MSNSEMLPDTGASSLPPRRVVITGAASGFGLLTARTLLERGDRVVATMRDCKTRNVDVVAGLAAFAITAQGSLEVVELDVTDDKSVSVAAATILAHGAVDVVINNAGVMNIGVTEAYSMAELQAQFDVNTFGPARVAKAFLPSMRARRSGLLINVSSLAGRLVFPFFGAYCASKFALEALFEAYRYELSSFGVDCVIVQPGPFDSGLLPRSPSPSDQALVASYGNVAQIPEAMKAGFQQSYDGPDAPRSQDVADAIVALIAMEGRRPLRTVVMPAGQDFGVDRLNRSVSEIQNGLLIGMQFAEMI
ncbi:MAG: SDR family oxidoreductase [Novosphingobium sp.]|nr:SDR family oxidoreductase [Novosphingobium sp.]